MIYFFRLCLSKIIKVINKILMQSSSIVLFKDFLKKKSTKSNKQVEIKKRINTKQNKPDISQIKYALKHNNKPKNDL